MQIRLSGRIFALGRRDSDSNELRLQKSLLVAASLMMALLSILWGSIYLITGIPLAASIPYTYSILSFISIGFFSLTGRFRFFRFSQLLLVVLLPFALLFVLGGFVQSSAVVLWSLMSPIGALVFAGRRRSIIWFLLYVLLVIISGWLTASINMTSHLPEELVIVFFVLNIAGVSLVAFVLLQYFVQQKDRFFELLQIEQRKSENLLLNILPKDIAVRLKEDQSTIAERCESVSILFADLVGFTPLSATLSPQETVEFLNTIYTHFDDLIDKHDVEKIRTIGDSYMVAAGIPRERPDHARVLAQLALDMQAYINAQPPYKGFKVNTRIGINTGPAIAGVIGHKKFHYDVWGDSVNTASRMESHGVPGKIQISEATYIEIRDYFECEPRGIINVKGKGEMKTWFLVGKYANG